MLSARTLVAATMQALQLLLRYSLLLMVALSTGCASAFEYGNYCGLERSDPTGRKPAIDAIDCACKVHDACYRTPDDPVACCDAALVRRLMRARCTTSGFRSALYRELAIFYFSIPLALRNVTGFHSPSCKERSPQPPAPRDACGL